jgi:Xaa-Pro aminopeptidase
MEEGMVVTIEPGIYMPKIGGARIEDTVVVTAEGCRCLTRIAKKFQQFPA